MEACEANQGPAAPCARPCTDVGASLGSSMSAWSWEQKLAAKKSKLHGALFSALPHLLHIACGLLYFQRSPFNSHFVCRELWQWQGLLCACWVHFLPKPSSGAPWVPSPTSSASRSCSELPRKEQQMSERTQFFMAPQLPVALWIAAARLTVVPAPLTPLLCKPPSRSGGIVLLSESAPCLCPSLQPLHTGDCGAIFMGRIIFLFSYAENDQTSEPGWRKIPTVVGNGLIKSCANRWKSLLPSSWPLQNTVFFLSWQTASLWTHIHNASVPADDLSRASSERTVGESGPWLGWWNCSTSPRVLAVLCGGTRAAAACTRPFLHLFAIASSWFFFNLRNS